jgi:hypothetical protein
MKMASLTTFLYGFEIKPETQPPTTVHSLQAESMNLWLLSTLSSIS